MPLSEKTVMVVGALPESLVNFRGDLIRQLVAEGARVVAMAAPAKAETIAAIEALGARYESYPVSRAGLDPIADARTLYTLARAMARIEPDYLIAYTVKPVVYGGLATIWSPRTTFVAMITGLGFALGSGSWARAMLRRLVNGLYRLSLGRASRVLFQNQENQTYFVEHGIVSPGATGLIAGSGVNLQRFLAQPMPGMPFKVLMASRLLREKGVIEYCEAAKRVKRIHPDVQFQLVGPEDPSPDGLTLAQIRPYIDSGAIVYTGEVQDIRPVLAGCHLFVLPSYHEGRPRTVQEALAIGRPVLTTSAPGCRDAIMPGVSGFVVPPGDVRALADELERLARSPQQVLGMAGACRKHAEDVYDVHVINREIIQSLIARSSMR